MNRWFAVAAVLAAGASLLHAVAGERLLLAPLRADTKRRVAAAVWESVWHLITWHLLCLAGSLAALVAWRAPGLGVVTLVQLAGYGVLFFLFGRHRLGGTFLVGLPQAPLFLTMAAFCAGGLLSQGRLAAQPSRASQAVAAVLASSIALVLVLLALLHLLWAAGSCWPARERKSLALLVVGVTSRKGMPSRGLTVLVALGLALGAGVVLLGTGAVPTTAGRLAALAAWGLVLLFAARGIGGFFEQSLRPVIRGTPYAHWNERLYSPLCLSLAILLALALPP